MSLRTLMQAGPAKANDLFARLLETSDGAVKTREKLFAELKGELELHTSLEEQHLFPILRRNAETKELVGDAIKDNKELRTKLAELEALPKNDETFSERLKELQKTFRQHARDEKRELLPAVQRALSEEQVQSVTKKFEAGVAEAELAKHDEVEARRAKVRKDREQAERQAAQQEAISSTSQTAAKQARQGSQEEAAERGQDEGDDRLPFVAQTAERTATTAETSALQIAEETTTSAQRVGAEIRGAAAAYGEAVQTMAPEPQTIAALPGAAIGAVSEIRLLWTEWLRHTMRIGTYMSQDLPQKVAEQQRRFATRSVIGWLEYNTRAVKITTDLAEVNLQSFVNRLYGRGHGA
jgi:hypothetical protein